MSTNNKKENKEVPKTECTNFLKGVLITFIVIFGLIIVGISTCLIILSFIHFGDAQVWLTLSICGIISILILTYSFILLNNLLKTKCNNNYQKQLMEELSHIADVISNGNKKNK